MFGNSIPRAFENAFRGPFQPSRSNWEGKGLRCGHTHNLLRGLCVAAAGGGSQAVQNVRNRLVLGVGAVVIAATGVAVCWSQSSADGGQSNTFQTARPAWEQKIAAQPGVREELSPSRMLRKHPFGRLVTQDDHLFEGMLQRGQIEQFTCYSDTLKRQFHSVIKLGSDVCGYPSTVHGGLTASLIDETISGLYISLWRSGAIGLTTPGYTARLEIDYKKKIPPGSMLLCSTEVEQIDGRKVWMKATLSNGESSVFATGRALFVSPRLDRTLTSWIPGFQKGRKD